jgi:hypothetical protein
MLIIGITVVINFQVATAPACTPQGGRDNPSSLASVGSISPHVAPRGRLELTCLGFLRGSQVRFHIWTTAGPLTSPLAATKKCGIPGRKTGQGQLPPQPPLRRHIEAGIAAPPSFILLPTFLQKKTKFPKTS